MNQHYITMMIYVIYNSISISGSEEKVFVIAVYVKHWAQMTPTPYNEVTSFQKDTFVPFQPMYKLGNCHQLISF